MEAIHLGPADRQAFRDRTRRVYTKWTEHIGPDPVRSAEQAIDATQERLINWGYAVCDAALRKHWNGLSGVNIQLPKGFPHGQGY